MKKQNCSLSEAVERIESGSTVMIGGFGGSGAPIELIHALIDRFRKSGVPTDLTVINNNAGNGGVGIAAMIKAGMVAKMVCSFPRSSNADAFNSKYVVNEIELELVPQGTLAERIRAKGAGIPAFYTPASYGTDIAKGKPTQEFDGKMHVMELALAADFALIKAERGDTAGNLTYRLAGRNFSPLMAMAADTTIVQVSKLVNVGDIDPEVVITPGIFVDVIVGVAEPHQEESLVRSGVIY